MRDFIACHCHFVWCCCQPPPPLQLLDFQAISFKLLPGMHVFVFMSFSSLLLLRLEALALGGQGPGQVLKPLFIVGITRNGPSGLAGARSPVWNGMKLLSSNERFLSVPGVGAKNARATLYVHFPATTIPKNLLSNAPSLTHLLPTLHPPKVPKSCSI